MAEGDRHDLGVHANHQLQMAEPSSCTWRAGPESAIRPARFDGTATCSWGRHLFLGAANQSWVSQTSWRDLPSLAGVFVQLPDSGWRPAVPVQYRIRFCRRDDQ